jgi:transketolase
VPLPPFASDAERIAWMRRTIARLSFQASSAHLGSSLSCVEIVDAILSAGDLRPDTVDRPDRDRLILSKGHAAMAWYTGLAAHGLLATEHLDVYLKNDTALWGHVTRTPEVPAIDASTGSLGHGLGVAVGYALGARLRGWSRATFCVLSDGECDEGSVWEAASFAGHHRLGRLFAIVDYNKVQSIGSCDEVLTKEPFVDRWRSFGWACEHVDGHDRDALLARIRAHDGARPLALLADTIKGKGIPRIEGTVASHYKPALASDVEAL